MTEREREYLRGVHLRDQVEAAAQDVHDHFAAVAAGLRTEIQDGRLTRDDAILRLVTEYKLTHVGAADILDRC